MLTMASLSLTGAGRLNLADSNAIIDYSGASPISTIGTWLGTGYHGGLWNGNGIDFRSPPQPLTAHWATPRQRTCTAASRPPLPARALTARRC